MELIKFNKNLLDEVKKDKYAGNDPFDGLNSKFIDWSPTLKKSILGLAWTQFFKRSPINFRPLFLVPKKRNPKGVGLFILGLLQDFSRTKDTNYLDEAESLGRWLLTQQCDKSVWDHSCWGYHFDWKAKAFYVPKGKPNVITTIYVAQALYELSKAIPNGKEFESVAFDSALFIQKYLYSNSTSEGEYIAYIPGENAFVHNASLWGAAWLAVVGKATNNTTLKDIAKRVAKKSVNQQADDGSWVYGAMPHHQFIDGFHTGYNLEALDIIRKSLEIDDFNNSIEKGLDYYESAFFTEDGIAKYYHNNTYPLDMHSVSQAIITLIKIEPTATRVELAKRVIDKSFSTLYLQKENRFAYQKTKQQLNKVNYTRWTQAWVYYSFAYYLNFKTDSNS
ncbi:aspartate-semialdehyde dehydrogenase [Psychrosphaera haliotis]|uniref:Aspartate-semialdehyde dehydrogenase n=1 Tax=Psychrosphaera haliotis TaxID=555083 RepID=A0A6N8FA71_9GAMM|nr:aspartate-semialdehyde dehydrogenase [Psychrosphaera haliotis]MUH71341.1 aspartate-semialdehyde dehydrogenase [Psychrosphaera haliotis]